MTEVTMARVKSLYRYKGQGMGFEKGEVSLTPEVETTVSSNVECM